MHGGQVKRYIYIYRETSGEGAGGCFSSSWLIGYCYQSVVSDGRLIVSFNQYIIVVGEWVEYINSPIRGQIS